MLISNAYAQAAGATDAGGGLASFLPFVLMFVVLYFFMIRPQMKRQKEQKNMMAALKVGDEVSTMSGLMGKIVRLEDAVMTLEIAKDVEVKMQKSAVSALLPPGTI